VILVNGFHSIGSEFSMKRNQLEKAFAYPRGSFLALGPKSANYKQKFDRLMPKMPHLREISVIR